MYSAPLMNWLLKNAMNLIIAIGACGAVISAVFAIFQSLKIRKRETPDLKIGFAVGNEVSGEKKTRSLINYLDGTRKIYFRIQNDSNFSIKTPICSIKFPEILKHKRWIDKSDATRIFLKDYTIISDLWNLGKGTTNINMNLPNSMWEIYGMPTLLLRSGEKVDFFVRFKIPETAGTYTLEMKLDAEGTNGFTRELKLIVYPKLINVKQAIKFSRNRLDRFWTETG